LNKKELATLIHDYNLACKDSAEKGTSCELCWRLAGVVLIYQGNRFIADGSLRRDE